MFTKGVNKHVGKKPQTKEMMHNKEQRKGFIRNIKRNRQKPTVGLLGT